MYAKGTSTKFQIVLIIVSNGAGREEKTYAFLDIGSEETLVSQQLSRRLRLQGPSEMLHLKWSNDSTRLEEESMKLLSEILDIGKVANFQAQ